ncbi:MAG: hypothetical protein KC493_04560 [Bacteriovoracaceae bacterium]|nr:hypothetical protein [Bacteriovoracaceae bacterium]
MNEKTNSKTSTVLQKAEGKPPEKDQPTFPTWGILVGLVIAFIILKSFVYIKDDKRHGK